VSSTVATAPSAPACAAARRSRPHIVAFDLIRLIIMVFVVSVHTLTFAGGRITVSIGAVTTVFHYHGLPHQPGTVCCSRPWC
jgi:hypothetical protein